MMRNIGIVKVWGRVERNLGCPSGDSGEEAA